MTYYFPVITSFLQVLIIAFLYLTIVTNNKKMKAMKAELDRTNENLNTVNKNYAIIERIITPFMEWVDQVQTQQEAMAKDAHERAKALFNPDVPKVPRKKQ